MMILSYVQIMCEVEEEEKSEYIGKTRSAEAAARNWNILDSFVAGKKKPYQNSTVADITFNVHSLWIAKYKI